MRLEACTYIESRFDINIDVVYSTWSVKRIYRNHAQTTTYITCTIIYYMAKHGPSLIPMRSLSHQANDNER